MWRLSIGLTCVLLSILCASHALGLFPDADKEILKRRQAVVEAITLNCATVINQGEDVASLRQVAASFQERNPEIVSLGIRKADGTLLVELGPHDAHWQTGLYTHSTPTHWHVPIAVDDRIWGSVEVRCPPLHREGIAGLLDVPLLRLAGFTLIAGLLGIHLYLRRVIRQGGPKAGSVMPERVKETLNTIVEGVLVLDQRERIAFANEAFARTAGVPSQKLQGVRASELPWNRSRGTASDLPWNRVLQDGKSLLGAVLKLRTENARSRIVSVNSTTIRDDKGSCLGALATFDDMTPVQSRNSRLRKLLRRLDRSRRKIIRQQSALEKAKEVAEAANKAKGDFLANVSHEIRTPMNAILGMTEVLLETEMSSHQKEHLQTVKASADALLVLINDLLDFAKIEAGKLTLDPIEFDLRECVGGTLKALALRAQDKGLELACDIPADVDDALLGDPGRLRQLLINLVGNAIKFTPEGEVVVFVRVHRRNDQLVELHFEVRDTGIGIPNDKLERIFDPFTQADGSTTRRFGGTGLGLAISARLVQIMGGRIWVESEVARGSAFHFTSTFCLPSRVTAPQAQAVLPSRPVLVADDNGTFRRIVGDMLNELGMQATLAANREEALDALARDTAYAAVLVDTALDGGFDVLEIAKSRSCAIPMLCSPERAQELARCQMLDLGICLSKPFQRSDLHRVLLEALTGKLPEREQQSSEPDASQPRLRLLVVDDNAFNRRVARLKLEKRSALVEAVDSGPEALKWLEKEAFDAVLLDLQMPVMDGFEVAAAIREHESRSGYYRCGHPIPIIAMTAHALDEIRQRCMEAGMEGYAVKPIHDRELWAEIARVTTPYARQRPASSHEPSPSAPASVDPTVALTRAGGNPALLQELLEVFIRDCTALTTEIQTAIAGADAAGVSRAAHTFKGMFGFFGAGVATAKAIRLEELSKQGNLHSAAGLVAELQREIDHIQHAIGAMTSP